MNGETGRSETEREVQRGNERGGVEVRARERERERQRARENTLSKRGQDREGGEQMERDKGR